MCGCKGARPPSIDSSVWLIEGSTHQQALKMWFQNFFSINTVDEADRHHHHLRSITSPSSEPLIGECWILPQENSPYSLPEFLSMSAVREKALGRSVVSIFLYHIHVDTLPVFVPSLPQTDRVSSLIKWSDIHCILRVYLSLRIFFDPRLNTISIVNTLGIV